MGKKDTTTKSYMANPRRFADAFNYYLFEGEQVIKADNLEPLDPTELNIFVDENAVEEMQKFRDLLKHCIIMKDEVASYILLGLENQSHIHYAMPVRNILYDALNYNRQYTDKAKDHRKTKDLLGDEFLSGFSKKDKIKPVITLTIYWGSREWDGPRSLHEMMDVKYTKLLKYVNDYPIHLIIPKEIDDYSKLHTELKKALHYIAVSDNKEEYKALIKNQEYQKIDSETADLLNVCMDKRIIVKEGEVQVDMFCEALDGIKEEGREEGREEGLVEGEIIGKVKAYLDCGLSYEDISEKIGLSVEQIKEVIKD